MLDSKKLVWDFDILGDEDIVQSSEEVVLAVNQTLEEYMFQAGLVSNLTSEMIAKQVLFQVRKSVMKVRSNVARSKHSQWWLGMKVNLALVLG